MNKKYYLPSLFPVEFLHVIWRVYYEYFSIPLNSLKLHCVRNKTAEEVFSYYSIKGFQLNKNSKTWEKDVFMNTFSNH